MPAKADCIRRDAGGWCPVLLSLTRSRDENWGGHSRRCPKFLVPVPSRSAGRGCCWQPMPTPVASATRHSASWLAFSATWPSPTRSWRRNTRPGDRPRRRDLHLSPVARRLSPMTSFPLVGLWRLRSHSRAHRACQQGEALQSDRHRDRRDRCADPGGPRHAIGLLGALAGRFAVHAVRWLWGSGVDRNDGALTGPTTHAIGTDGPIGSSLDRDPPPRREDRRPAGSRGDDRRRLDPVRTRRTPPVAPPGAGAAWRRCPATHGQPVG